MCGIAGIAAFGSAPPPSAELIRAMCDTMIYRGPDEEGLHVEKGVGLGMRRLAIIDLAGGQQPIFNEDRSVRTVFNGEIYNFRELRDELRQRGHRFETACDTEVIVHAYEEYGDGFADRLNGMFAIALHDMARGRLLLARDHLGIKPLYYSVAGRHLVFGSELKVLLASGLVPRRLNVDAVGQFLSWEYVPGADTLLQDVRKVEPAQLIDVDLATGRVAQKTFWSIPVDEMTGSADSERLEDEIDAKLAECVRRQLVSDVPLGAFLSGGVDSSLIAASMEHPRTFSIGFEDPTYNELPFSSAVSKHLGTDHVTEIIDPNAAELFDDLMHHLDDPIGDFSIFPTFMVSRLARRHVTVALSGDGGDELFGGYETYLANDMAQRYARIPGILRRSLIEPRIRALRPTAAKKGLVNKAKRFVEGLDCGEELSHARWRVFVNELARQELFTGDALQDMPSPVGRHIVDLHAEAGDRDALNRSLYIDVKSYLCDNILTKVDRMSMAVSLETRVPFLDKELVELAFRIPARFKVDRGETKAILKRVATRHIPRECVYRPKEGFSIPIKTWLGTQFKPIMDELLDSARLRQQGIFDADHADRLKAEHLSGTHNHSHTLWSMIVFEAWCDRWLSPDASRPAEKPMAVQASA